MLKDKKILLISPESWGNNFVSKHHYANYLGENNHVYFLNPAHSFSKTPLASMQFEQEKIKDQLTVIDYVNLVPRLNALPQKIQHSMYKKQAVRIHSFLGINEFDIVWSFDPYRFWDLKNFKSKKYIYHTVDFHPKAKHEQKACDSADLVIGIADLVIADLPTTNSQVIKIGHGADINGLSIKEPVKIPGENKIKACYVGNFHNHINYDLLFQMCTENQDVDFIMIGPTLNSNLSKANHLDPYMHEQLSNLNNLFFVGSVKAELLMSYMDQMDIHLILFQKKHEKTHCNPHKVLGYIYSGKVVLANYIDEYSEVNPEIITIVENNEDLTQRFKEIVTNLEKHNSNEKQEKRREFAKKNSYTNKLKEIESHLYSN